MIDYVRSIAITSCAEQKKCVIISKYYFFPCKLCIVVIYSFLLENQPGQGGPIKNKQKRAKTIRVKKSFGTGPFNLKYHIF
jgi:hypothetical protein